MSFARNFEAGQRMATGLIDTYKTAKRNGELQQVDQWKKSDEYDGYTEQDAAQMQAIANAKDADGKPYYQMQDDGRGGLQVKSDFSYAGSDGQTVAPGNTVGLAPRRVVDYGGQRYDSADLTDSRMQGLQDRERARIMGREDPVLGMRMRREMAQDERDGKRFGWEEQGQPLKQRAAELAISTGERNERAGVRTEEVQTIIDQVAAMPEDALKVYAAKLNTNQSNLPFLMTGESKDGYKFLTIDPASGTPTGKEFTLNSSQLRQMAAASVLGMMGKGAESLSLLSEVNKDVAKIVADMNGMTAATVGSQNDALSKGRADGFKQQATNNDNARLGLARAAAGRQADNDRLGKIVPMTGPNGEATYGELVLAGGKPTVRPVDLSGLRMPPGPPSAAQQAGYKVYAEALANNPEMPARERDRLVDQLGIRSLVGGTGGLSFDGPGTPPVAEKTKAPPVPGRPLYDTPSAELQQIAARPRGVSTQEANEARDELQKRKGESRMSGF